MSNFTFRISDLKKCLILGLLTFVFSSAIFADGGKEKDLLLTCPDDVIVTPLPGECGTFVDYSSLQWNSTLELADTIFNPGPQNYFTYGPTPVTLTVTSTSGTQEMCVFNVFVEQFPTPLVCDQNVFVYMEDSCQATLTADMILLGGPYGCNDVYTATIFSLSGTPIGNTVTPDMVGSVYNVEILDEQTNFTCFGSIIPRPEGLPQAIACPSDITIRCHESTEPLWTGEPDYQTCFEDSLLTVEFEDVRTNSYCDEDEIAFEIVRTWTVTNPFQGASSCEQLITARRLMLTEVIFPPDFDGTDEPPLDCDGDLPPLALADTSITGIPLVSGFDPFFLACNFSVEFTDSVQQICGNSYHIMRQWTALDYCRDVQIDHIQNILIEDVAAPSFSIPDPIYGSDQGVCILNATFPPIAEVEECSFFEVTIVTPWGEIAGNGGTIQISLEEGEYPVSYSVVDDCGNGTVTNTNFIIQSEVLPECPPLMSVSSQYFLENLSSSLDSGDYSVLAEFGYPQFAVNCDLTLTETVTLNLDDCTEGTIVRAFGVEETSGGCTQLIQVNHVSDFVVEFPTDTTIICGADSLNLPQPIVTNADSENIHISYTDDIMTDVPDFCYQILRTWVVRNDCVTGSQNDNETFEVAEADLGLAFPLCDLDGDGDCDDHTFRDSWSGAQMPGESEAAQTTNPDTDPDSDPWDGYIVYEQIINVIDSVAPVFENCEALPPVCILGNGCAGEVTLPMPEISDCSAYTLSAQASLGGPTQTGFGPFSNISPGTYEVSYFAIDACENQSTCETTIEVLDCTPPTPVCQTQVILTIEPGTPPSAGILAADLNNGSTDNCPGGLQFSFSPTPGDLGRVYFCDDLGQQNLQLYVTDLAGNQDSCEIFILVQEPSAGFCGGTPGMTIPGNIYTEQSEGIQNVEVASSQGFSAVTNGNGAYSIPFENAGSNLTLTPFFDDTPSNGVTTFDALLIVKHVLGSELLGSPYKIISADVNGSNTVTTFDALTIRKLILDGITEFPAGSWRFIPEEFNFPNPLDPFETTFPEVANLSIPPPAFGPDFIGTKVGDVNNSADPNLVSLTVDERDSGHNINISLSNDYTQMGNTFEVPVTLPEVVLQGFQFALDFDLEKVEILSIEPGTLDENAFGKKELASGILRVSWYSALPVEKFANSTAFTLVLRAKENGKPSEMISLNPEKLRAEAYTPELKIHGIELDFASQKTAQKELVLLPNRPEPFSEKTIVPFELPAAGIVEFHVFDLSGKVLKKLKRHFAEGYHEIEINGEELSGNGVYFYQIKTENGTAEGKMVKQ